jgi:dihydrofolate synthase / folylpolyglutamate synthase
MIYAEAIQFLYGLRTFGTKLGLENTRKLAALAGNPQARLRFIHVAGTNGKGSTCAMLESVYRAARLRVGLFTSPHLIAFGERIQVNRQSISERDIVRLVEKLKGLLVTFRTAEHPTFFEVVTIMALLYFEEQKCDLVIWETGLGGRLDATNIVTPLASVITNIQFDHEQWLGKTLESIASEKAGIIKPRVPVITATQDSEALAVIEDAARERNAPLTRVVAKDTDAPPLDHLKLPLLGQHQKWNAALAIATIRALRTQISISEPLIREALPNVEWAGRLQVMTGPSGQRILLDGAHNASGAEALRTAMDEYFPNTAFALLLGVLADKNWRAICDLLAPGAEQIFLAPVGSERTAAPHELATACRAANPTARVTECASLKQALEQALQHEFLVITGSLYLVGEALEIIGGTRQNSAGERGLNEWGEALKQPAGKKFWR